MVGEDADQLSAVVARALAEDVGVGRRDLGGDGARRRPRQGEDRPEAAGGRLRARGLRRGDAPVRGRLGRQPGRRGQLARRRCPPTSPSPSARRPGCWPRSGPRSTCSATSRASRPRPRASSRPSPGPGRGSSTRARRPRGCGPSRRQAVLAGGGVNHRIGLFDAILIKENHIALAGGLAEAVGAARAANPDLPVEVECRDLDEVAAALGTGADRLLLDNMDARRPARGGRAARRAGPAPETAPPSRPRVASTFRASAGSPRPGSR